VPRLPERRRQDAVLRLDVEFRAGEPSAATASSIVPYASVRRSSFGIRSPPYRRPVVPSSPRPVATIDSRRVTT
jgi:hypothetical protein